jgi:hypothetical protein
MPFGAMMGRPQLLLSPHKRPAGQLHQQRVDPAKVARTDAKPGFDRRHHEKQQRAQTVVTAPGGSSHSATTRAHARSAVQC